MLNMEMIIKLGLLASIILGMAFLFLSIFVLHTYEVKTKQRPPSVQFWPFNNEIKAVYPELSKIGRTLTILAVICGLPWVVNFAIST